jgi:hypothetical protein
MAPRSPQEGEMGKTIFAVTLTDPHALLRHGTDFGTYSFNRKVKTEYPIFSLEFGDMRIQRARFF